MSSCCKDDAVASKDFVHDINSSISALQGAIEIIRDEWRTNPELVEKLLPLTRDKISQLQGQLKNFNQDSKLN